MFGFGKKSSNDERKKAEEKTTKVTSKDSNKEDAELTKAKSKSSLNKVDRDDEEPEVVIYDRSEGPHDIGEVDDTEEYIDLGALYIKMLDGLNLRLEMDEGTGAVIAATCIRAGGTLQIQAFAAPRSTGIWDDIRHDLAESVASQGGTAEMYTGEFGAEMLTRLPATTEDGKRGERIARFVGVDGPRWFLRGVISGEAVLGNEEAAEAIEEVFRTAIVNRGDDPRPPRELLPMTMPEQIYTLDDSDDEEQEPEEQVSSRETETKKKKNEDKRELRPMPRRGPEITEIG